jgi:membrane-bound serine protease (ClpP class)
MTRSARAALPALLAVSLAAAARAETVFVTTVSGGINPAVSDHLQKAIARARDENAVALVVELDTPGGLLSSTKDIVNAILNAEVPVVVYVSPRGAWAASAGTFITLAGHVAAMAPGTSIGAAHPVSLFPGGPPPPRRPGEGEKKPEETPVRDASDEKIENFAAAFMQSIAQERKRNVEWAIQAVRESKAITQREALEKKVIDLVAEDLDELLQKVDGRKLRVARQDVKLATRDARVVRLEMSLVNRFLNLISDPQIALLLIFAGLLGLYVEFTQPGVVVPGIAGAICLVLAGLALQIIPFNGIGLLLIFAGVALLVAELFVPSFGLLFVSGVLCLAAGGYMVFDVPEESDIAVPFWQVVAPSVAAVGIFGGIVVFLLGRTMLRPAVAGVETLRGASATVERDLDPAGTVSVRGELWSAEADERIPRGERVQVVAVDNLKLRVKRAPAREESG